MDDSELIKRLTLEWTKAQPAVARFVRSFVRNQSDADDILQEIALVIVDRFENYDPSRPFIGWSLGIARNLVKAHFRKQLHRPSTLEDETAVDRVAEAFETLNPEWEDRKEALERCIESVPASDRRILSLHYDEDLKPAAIAGKIGKTPNHVAVLLHRLRSGLRQCVERKMNIPGNPILS